jgi:hypothetical protein
LGLLGNGDMESALEQMINIVDIVVGLKAMYVEFRACVQGKITVLINC